MVARGWLNHTLAGRSEASGQPRANRSGADLQVEIDSARLLAYRAWLLA